MVQRAGAIVHLPLAVVALLAACASSEPPRPSRASGATSECKVSAESCTASGCDGWVEVEYDITPAGTTAYPVVKKSCPPGVFDEAAVKTIEAQRYPTSPDGKKKQRMLIEYNRHH